MQRPDQLTNQEINDLRFWHDKRRDSGEVTTTSGQAFSYLAHCEMAYMIWQRFGKNNQAFQRAWSRMMESNPEVADLMPMVAAHVFHTLEDH